MESVILEDPDNRAGRDNLLDAGEDAGRVENLEDNIEQQQQAETGEQT